VDVTPNQEVFEEALNDAEVILSQVLSFLPKDVHPSV